LRAHAPRSPKTVLVHGDFKVGNVLLGADGHIVGLLDWELAHLGDPHEDLGWVTQPLRTKEHYIKGSWERDELLAYYEAASGCPVDRDAVHWWNVFAAYKTAVMQASGLRAFREGRSEEHYKPTAPVLLAILRAALGPNAVPQPVGHTAWSPTERDAFLAWDTTHTLMLLGAGPAEGPQEAVDPVGANNAARAALCEFIAALTFDERHDERRSTIGRHLLQRVSSDPALARRPTSNS
jgi:Phosphotransferase enzyme family